MPPEHEVTGSNPVGRTHTFMKYMLIMSTAGSKKEADLIAETLVEEKLAACVNIIPVATSVYKWKNELCRDSELLLFIKTAEPQTERVEARISEIHSYDNPEIIFLPIEGGSQTYLDWINESV